MLHARIGPGPANEFTVYDGARIAAAPGTISVAPGSVYKDGFMLEVLRAGKPAILTVDGMAAGGVASRTELDAGGGWFWEAARGGTLWIKLGGGAHTIGFR